MNNIILLLFTITYINNCLAQQELSQNIFYKNQLRELFEKEQNKLIEEAINLEYQAIYDLVIIRAKNGLYNLGFNLFCISKIGVNRQPGEHLANYYITISRHEQLSDGQPKPFSNYKYPSQDILVSKVLEKIKKSFPDSMLRIFKYEYDDNYIKRLNQCVLYYTLEW